MFNKKVVDLKWLKEKIKEKNWIEDKELLKVVVDDYRGRTVAHIQAENGWRTNDKEILMLADNTGWTVAHEQAEHGWITEDKEILKLEEVCGWTVAHEQARNGWVTEDEEILKLRNSLGLTVYAVIIDFWDEKSLDKIDKNFSKLYSFVLKAKELGFTSITETLLYENVMDLAKKKKMFIQNVLKQNVLKQKRNNLNKKKF